MNAGYFTCYNDEGAGNFPRNVGASVVTIRISRPREGRTPIDYIGVCYFGKHVKFQSTLKILGEFSHTFTIWQPAQEYLPSKPGNNSG